MALVSIEVIEITGGYTDKIDRDWDVSLRVITDTADDQAPAVLGYVSAEYPLYTAMSTSVTGVDLFGNNTDYGAYALRPRSARRQSPDCRTVWNVDLPFTSKSESDDGEDYDDPLDKPAVWSGSFQVFQKPAVDDAITGDPIVNSAGSAFDPQPQKDGSFFVETCTKNISEWDLGFWTDLHGKVNSDHFQGFFPGEVRLLQVTYSEQHQRDDNTKVWSKYYTVNMTFGYKEDDYEWGVGILDEGWHVLADGKLEVALDESTPPKPYNVPILLDGAGAQLAVGADPVVKEFDLYDERAFSVMLPYLT